MHIWTEAFLSPGVPHHLFSGHIKLSLTTLVFVVELWLTNVDNISAIHPGVGVHFAARDSCIARQLSIM
jgi:hypothetical protein